MIIFLNGNCLQKLSLAPSVRTSNFVDSYLSTYKAENNAIYCILFHFENNSKMRRDIMNQKWFAWCKKLKVNAQTN